MYSEVSEEMNESCEINSHCNDSLLFKIINKSCKSAVTIMELNRDLRDIFTQDFTSNLSVLNVVQTSQKFSQTFKHICLIQSQFIGKTFKSVHELRQFCIDIGINVNDYDSDSVFLIKLGLSYCASIPVLEYILNTDYKIVYTNTFTHDSGMPSMQIREYALRHSTEDFPIFVLGDILHINCYDDSEFNVTDPSKKFDQKLTKLLWNSSSKSFEFNGNTHLLYYIHEIPFQSYCNYFMDDLPFIVEAGKYSMIDYYVFDNCLDPLLQFETSLVNQVLNECSEIKIHTFYQIHLKLLFRCLTKVNRLGIILSMFYPGSTNNVYTAYGHCMSIVINKGVGIFYDSTHDLKYRNASIMRMLTMVYKVKTWYYNTSGPQKQGSYCCLYAFTLISELVKCKSMCLKNILRAIQVSPTQLPIAKFTMGMLNSNSRQLFDNVTDTTFEKISENVLLRQNLFSGFYYF